MVTGSQAGMVRGPRLTERSGTPAATALMCPAPPIARVCHPAARWHRSGSAARQVPGRFVAVGGRGLEAHPSSGHPSLGEVAAERELLGYYGVFRVLGCGEPGGNLFSVDTAVPCGVPPSAFAARRRRARYGSTYSTRRPLPSATGGSVRLTLWWFVLVCALI